MRKAKSSNGSSKSRSKRKPKSQKTNNSQGQEANIPEQKPEMPLTYEFINNQMSRFLYCPFCTELMTEPLRLHPCGHTYCKQCAPKSRQPCPSCQVKVQVSQPDLIAQGLVNQMLVKCTNNGCSYTDSFESYKNYHKDCSFKNITGGLDEWMRNMRGTFQTFQRTKKKVKREGDEDSDQEESYPLPVRSPIREDYSAEYVEPDGIFASKFIKRDKQEE